MPYDSKATDYAISTDDAQWLQAVALLPADDRLRLIEERAAAVGAPAMLALFAQMVGLANSVAANCREMAELVLIAEAGWDERTAESINLPTVFGALHGVRLAASVRGGRPCEGCAFRLGTPANQSPITTSDAAWAGACDERFMCHERGLADGEPTVVCAGFARARRDGLI